MNRKLSLEARVHNCAAAQEVEFVHAMHTYFHAKMHTHEEWSQIWSMGNPDIDRFDTASWAHFFGRMRGFRSVWQHSVTEYDLRGYGKYAKVMETFPEAGGLDMRSLGEVSCHSLASDIVEVADDGLSARATFFTPGNIFCACEPNGKRRSYGLWERYGADFVYEDGCWLFLHEQVCPDMNTGCDCMNTGLDEYKKLTDPPKGNRPPPPMAEMEDPGPLHTEWTPIKPPADSVPWPVPYRTLDNENSFTHDR